MWPGGKAEARMIFLPPSVLALTLPSGDGWAMLKLEPY